MAKKIDPRLIEILTQYGEDATEALWDCHGTWVAYHKAIERIAAKANVVFDMPQIIEANSASKVVAIAVRGTMGERAEWSFGEASPGNNKNAYPYAMAEKRAKDRVVLKLVGLHGLVYSEEESDDFKPSASTTAAPAPAPSPKSKADARPIYAQLQDDMRKIGNKLDLTRWMRDPDVKALRAQLPVDWDKNLREAAADFGRGLPETADDFPGDMPPDMKREVANHPLNGG